MVKSSRNADSSKPTGTRIVSLLYKISKWVTPGGDTETRAKGADGAGAAVPVEYFLRQLKNVDTAMLCSLQ